MIFTMIVMIFTMVLTAQGVRVDNEGEYSTEFSGFVFFPKVEGNRFSLHFKSFRSAMFIKLSLGP